jgi:UPF0716 protein FxsA
MRPSAPTRRAGLHGSHKHMTSLDFRQLTTLEARDLTMRRFKMIALGLLALPAAEIVAFVVVASLTGLATAFVLLVLTSLAGIVVLRNLGEGAVTRLRTAAGEAKMTAVGLDGAGIATALGGILLVIPGFITGILGAMAVFPLTRKWLMLAFRRLLASHESRSGPPVIDLEPDEWHQMPSPKLPPRRREPKP